MDKNIHLAVGIIVTKNSKLLLGKRKNAFGAGSWGLPAGHLEYGETLVECAVRELKEETGITADKNDLAFFTIVDAVRADSHYVHVGFELQKEPGEITLMEPDKCEGWEFFDKANLPDPIFIGNQGIIEAYLKKSRE